MTTFILSMFNAGLVSKASEPVVLGLALAYGGIAQFAAGMWEFRTGNTFGAVAFTSYGAFWVSFWAFVTFFAGDIPPDHAASAVGLYLISWFIFTVYGAGRSLRLGRQPDRDRGLVRVARGCDQLHFRQDGAARDAAG
jgi:succinate-acetate transporter protein